MQTIFIRGPSATIRMILLVLASIGLMTLDQRWQTMEKVRGTLSSIVYPVQYTIDLPIRLYHWADEVISSNQTLLDKNREFSARLLESRVQLQKLDILEKENERLRRLLSATEKNSERLLISEIIKVDVDPYRQLILINKGTNNDVYRGQPIIDSQGVFGQIVHVGLLSSTAILISDASHAIPVQVDRTGLRTNAFGTGKIDRLKLRHLPHNVDIKVGDMLTSSGLGGIFPPNYPVATITRVDRPPGEPFASIEAMPLAQLDKSREVLLVWRNTHEFENMPNLETLNADEELSSDTADMQPDTTPDQPSDKARTGQSAIPPAKQPTGQQSDPAKPTNKKNTKKLVNKTGSATKNEPEEEDPELSGDDFE